MGFATKDLSRKQLVIITVLVLIFIVAPLTLYTAWNFKILHRESRFAKAHNKQVERSHKIQQRLTVIKEALSGIVFYEHNPELYAFNADTGDYDYPSISFVSRVPSHFPGGKKFAGQSMRRIRFAVEDGEEGERELVMYQTPLLQSSDTIELNPNRKVLLPKLDSFMCVFWSPSVNAWIDEWVETNSVPPRIKFELAQKRADGSATLLEDIHALNISILSQAITQKIQNPTLPAPSRGRSSSKSPPSRVTTSKPRVTSEQIAAWRKRQAEQSKGRSHTTSRYTEAQKAEYRKRMAERHSGTTDSAVPSLPPGMVSGELGMLFYKGNGSRQINTSTSGRTGTASNLLGLTTSGSSRPTSRGQLAQRLLQSQRNVEVPGTVSGELGLVLYTGKEVKSVSSKTNSTQPTNATNKPTGLVSGELGLLLYKGP
jgi:hypothetical protein